MAEGTLTPMMRQYKGLKEKYADCLLFFRLGDFYELFFDDAVEGSRLLNLTLTKRHTAPMCGIPYHAVDSYLGRLTKLGKKVAICEQMSDPSLPGIVERDVIRVITPGTTFDPRILDEKSNHFIVSVIFEKAKSGNTVGLALCDLTTGLFQVATPKNLEELEEEIFRLRPAECIIDAAEKNLPVFLKKFENLPVFPHQCWDESAGLLQKQFGVKDLRGFGIDELPEVVAAAALLVSYLRETQKSDLAHLRPPLLLTRASEMILDQTAIRNLELIESLRGGTKDGSLFSVIDMTKTPMGGRMLRHWLLHPLASKIEIENRLNAVAEIIKDFSLKTKIPQILTGVLDMERLLSRISLGTGNARDILGIAISLRSLTPVREILSMTRSSLLQNLFRELQSLDALEILQQSIQKTIVENPPLSVKDGDLICNGVNEELDSLRTICREGKNFIQKMQESEIQKTGINSLKIRYNQVFGYYIEVTKSNFGRVPQHYIRKQTLVNCERFITPELKEYEEKILGAEEKMKTLEYELFLQIREQVKSATRQIQKAAQIFGTLDTLLSLASVAEKNRYACPHIKDAGAPLIIENGRHPVVEHLASGKFVPNDVSLGSADAPDSAARVILLTGPNMGGKSTYLRQTALIVLLAHIGSFVPADSAQIPLIDRIFTRVGASDNLAAGQSTFMVEMQETAQILHYATENSLIILDEIGRGTSTYDGVSLAWAILEYVHDHVRAKTLFATHYHELISVAEKLTNAANYSVAVKNDAPMSHRGSNTVASPMLGLEEKENVVFLYRIVKGAIDRSYGIEVARLAGLPKEVISKAKNILQELEEGMDAPFGRSNTVASPRLGLMDDSAVTQRVKKDRRDENQLEIFAKNRPHRVIEELKDVEVDKITPLEALKKLDEWKRLA